MKILMALIVGITITSFVCEAFAQCQGGQGGTSSGTNQCNLNQRPATPAPVPQVTPASVEQQRIVDEDALADDWKAPKVTFASLKQGMRDESGRLVAQPTGGVNLGLVNVNRDRRDPSAEAYIERLSQEVNDLENQVMDLRAQGKPVDLDEVKQAFMASQMSPEELFQTMRSSPSFQNFVRQMAESKNDDSIVTWEVIPVE